MRGGRCLLTLPRVSSPVTMFATLIITMIMDNCLAIPGDYFTKDTLTNKYLPNEIDKMPILTRANCENYCVQNDQCDAYAISLFERKCELYNSATSGAPIQNNGYSIFVRRKTQEDGYYVYQTMYIKLGLNRLNAYEAANACARENGLLLAVKNSDIEDIMSEIMNDHKVWTALHGISDAASEGNWVYSDGSPATYQNWDWNGFWPRVDLNCAIATNNDDGIAWRIKNCLNRNHYFCQIPMF